MSTQVATKEDQQLAAESEEAHAIETQIKAALADGREALWRLAEALYEFDEVRGWLKLGRDTLTEWLADSDVTLTRGTYYRLVRTWRKLVVERKIAADRVRMLDQSKVAIVVDAVATNKATVDDAFADVEALGASDLRAKYQSRAPREGEDEEPISEAETPQDDDAPDEEPDVIEGNAVEDDDEEPEVETESETQAEPEPEETTSPMMQALVDAEALPWDELEAARSSNASFPRIKREVVVALLQWRETHLAV